jgi:proteasome assembly chaperone 2
MVFIRVSGMHAHTRLLLVGTQLFFLQQRAPAATGRQEAYAESLASWLQSQGVQHVVVLSGLDAQFMRDKQIEGPRIRSVSGTVCCPHGTRADAACKPALPYALAAFAGLHPAHERAS